MSRLYLVEDHLIVLEGLRAMLEAALHTVVGESADPRQAIEDLQRLLPDLVLLDLSLGHHSGFEVLAEVQRRKLSTRCIVVTMLTQPRHVAEAIRLGAYGYVLKTEPAQELKVAISTVLQGRRHFGSAVADLAVQALSNGMAQVDAVDTLSRREGQILAMVVRGMSSAAIGIELDLSAKTVDTYRSRMMAKLGVSNVIGLLRFAIRAGLADPE